jgi:hypothetical protein
MTHEQEFSQSVTNTVNLTHKIMTNETIEKEIKYLKEMVLLLVDFNAKQVEINRQLSDDIKALENE